MRPRINSGSALNALHEPRKPELSTCAISQHLEATAAAVTLGRLLSALSFLFSSLLCVLWGGIMVQLKW